MKIHKWDIVKVIAGKDKWKDWKILRVFSEKNLVIVEWINKVCRHVKKQGATPGKKVTFEKGINISNVALICPHTKEITKIWYNKIIIIEDWTQYNEKEFYNLENYKDLKIKCRKKIRISKKSWKQIL